MQSKIWGLVLGFVLVANQAGASGINFGQTVLFPDCGASTYGVVLSDQCVVGDFGQRGDFFTYDMDGTKLKNGDYLGIWMKSTGMGPRFEDLYFYLKTTGGERYLKPIFYVDKEENPAAEVEYFAYAKIEGLGLNDYAGEAGLILRRDQKESVELMPGEFFMFKQFWLIDFGEGFLHGLAVKLSLGTLGQLEGRIEKIDPSLNQFKAAASRIMLFLGPKLIAGAYNPNLLE